MTHPLAFSENESGFQDSKGNHVKAGDRVFCTIRNLYGVIDEALQDGDAYVTWDSGEFATVKWCRLLLASPSAERRKEKEDEDIDDLATGIAVVAALSSGGAPSVTESPPDITPGGGEFGGGGSSGGYETTVDSSPSAPTDTTSGE